LNTDLAIAVVQALHPDVGYVAQWRQALRVIGGEAEASSQVRVQNRLPEEFAAFTGRLGELDRLRHALLDGQRDDRAETISVIAGMAGVGKSELAMRAAHLLIRERPDTGVLFVNLRGFHPDPAQPPVHPAAVLDGFLRLLGVPGQQIPHDLAARRAAYRDRLAGTHTLVVLDNAADAEQVRPLLPQAPGCVTLVTSRRSLTDLRPATHLAVDVFTAEEALEFLARAVPEIPAGADPLAAARIVGRCGYLPLALGLLAGRIRSTPGWTLTDHADRLDERQPHRQLESGVELALNLSYRHLPAEQKRLLRLAALHPGQDLDEYAVAALTDADLSSTRAQLEVLCRDHLLKQESPCRYSFHDLVRAYAVTRATDEDPPPERRRALNRLLDYYLAATANALDAAYEGRHGPAVPATDSPTPDVADRDRADRWLDTELANLLAAAQHAATHSWPEHTWQLSAILEGHLRTRGRFHDAEALHYHALDAARLLGDRQAEMNALNALGYVHRRLGLAEQAGDDYERALQIAQTIADRPGELNALQGLGWVHKRLGRNEQAAGHFGWVLEIARAASDRIAELNALTGLGRIDWLLGRYKRAAQHFGQALQIARTLGDHVGELTALAGLGDVGFMLGRYEQAASDYGRTLQIAQTVGHRLGELNALKGLGDVHRLQGRQKEALGHYERALQIAQTICDRVGEMQALSGLGHVHRAQHRYGESADCYRRALDLALEHGSPNWQFEALQGLGHLHHANGRSDLALVNHGKALQLAMELAQPEDRARAHDGLAIAYHALTDDGRAREHWQCALEILISLGTDHTDELQTSVPNIRAHLARLES
jgi:tetratricopeptide (TPR) repeat protein